MCEGVYESMFERLPRRRDLRTVVSRVTKNRALVLLVTYFLKKTNDSHLKNDGTSVGATAPLSHTMARTHDAGALSYLRLSTDNRSWLRQPARGEPAEPPDPRVDPRARVPGVPSRDRVDVGVRVGFEPSFLSPPSRPEAPNATASGSPSSLCATASSCTRSWNLHVSAATSTGYPVLHRRRGDDCVAAARHRRHRWRARRLRREALSSLAPCVARSPGRSTRSTCTRSAPTQFS